MGTESSSTEGAPNNVSRRRVVAGAAWSVPAVMVASAAPAVAASKGLLTFTGDACKLPGNSSDYFKGYVFELTSTNAPGPGPVDTVVAITGVTINGNAVLDWAIKVVEGTPCSCQCGSVRSDQQFCVGDGTELRVLIYTANQATSENANMGISYTTYELSDLDPCTCGTGVPQPAVYSGDQSTSTIQDNPGGGSCTELARGDVFPLPPGPLA